ncbi:MAG: amidohydrolase family protein [Planctomycetes bacterium]|nr:amidohydrolase family protein [Planctomycetota bacterium]
MRIDSHAHGHAVNLNGSPKEYIARCKEEGVDAVVLIAKPDPLFASKKRMGSFVIPVAIIDIDEAKKDDIHRLFDQGAAGIKFICPNHPYGDERYFPFYKAIKERDGVAVFHTGYLMHDPEYTRYRVKLDDMRTSHIDTIERWVPHLRVLMAHFGNPHWEECWKMAWAHPTVYADLSGGTAIHRSMLMWREMFAPNGALMSDCLGKVCFGSDTQYFGEAHRFGPYIDFYERLFNEVGAPEELREKVNAGNILSLFKLEGL